MSTLPRENIPLSRHVAARLFVAVLLALGSLLTAVSGAPAEEGHRQVLRVVGDDNYPPFLFRDPSGRTVGYVADWWALWQQKTGVTVELNATTWAEAQRIIGRGEADAIDNIFRTPQREPLYEFTPPYAKVPVAIYSHVSLTTIHDIKDLRGFQVGAMAGDACVDILRLQGISTFRLFRSYTDLINAALAEDVKLFCMDEHPANYYLYRQGAQKAYRKAFQLYEGEFHRAVRRGDSATLRLIERGTRAISADEDRRLRDRWLKPPDGDYWHYARYVGAGAGLLAAVSLVLLAWLWSTRAAVRHQTAALSESEERFRRLFEETRQAITLVEGGRFVAANRASLAMLRRERPEQLLGHTPTDISPEYQPDGRRSDEKVVEVIRFALEKGSHEFEWEHLRADGEPFTARVLLTLIRQGEKELLHVVWSDITAQKRAERELADNRQELERRVVERTAELAAMTDSLRRANEEQQAILDAATAGIMLMQERVVRRCNRTLEQLMGYEPGELVGQTTRIFYPDDQTFREVEERIKAGIARQGFHTEECLQLRKDGSCFWARVSVRAIDAGDPGKGLAGMCQDITAEHAAKAEMARARDLAEEAARTKSTFLANMSHEIRTPMNAIIGMSYLALKTNPTPQQRNYLHKIRSSGQHLLGILNDILDFSKIDAGKMTVERIDFDLEKVLTDVTNLIAERVAEKGIELILEIDPAVPWHLQGDPLRIGQVLLNFANNAVKFTEQGEITIGVRVADCMYDDLLLQFSVRDTGIGIDESQRRSLFQSFQQADSSTTRKYGGTGLGLVIAKRLAELLGGEVGVESTPGQGATFWFTARLGKGATTVRHPLLRSDLQGRRMLVVDDNAAAREVVGGMLRGMSFVVTAVDSGVAALAELTRAAAASDPYDIVFLDWKMPGMDGIATARAIRHLPLKEPPLLLMVTACCFDDVRHAAEEAGIREVLVKPVSPSHLFDSVARVFGTGGGGEQQPTPAESGALPDLSAIAGARVLLVEDNDINQEVATDLLHEAGMDVDLAADGARALEKVRQNVYDIVFMDMQMPVMDGLAATREIRRLPETGELPIVAMTANALAGDRERCLAAGMNDHLAKPIEPAELWAALLKWVRPRQGTPQAGQPRTQRPVPDAGLFGTIAGVDVSLGLKRVLGRKERYLSLLRTFLAGQRDTAGRIRAALDAADTPTAERLAHTAKSVAGNIGATRLQECAAELEQAIRAQGDLEAIAPFLLLFEAGLHEVVEGVAAVLPPEESPGPVTFHAELLRSVCQRLYELFAEDDATATELFEENRLLLGAAYPDRFDDLAAAVRGFDFEAAEAILRDAVAGRTTFQER